MFEYTLHHTDGRARSWEFMTEHGSFKTPVFMPVWTKWTVKWIHPEEIDEMWAEIILNNTYHLYLRPWTEVIKEFSWAHNFQNHHKPILTDSWWFQVFSLWLGTHTWKSLVKIKEDWIHFRSIIDGSKHYFTAEKIMDIQSDIWADIIMAFDECAPWTSNKTYARAAMERTHRWAIRCKKRWEENNKKRVEEWLYKQALFPIIQGVTYGDLRIESAKFMAELDCPGVAIGWLAVWETKKSMYDTLDTIEPYLPKNKPRYLMWVWTPEDLIEAIYRWVDMFDCVLPTRIGRHKTAFSRTWYIKVKNKKHQFSKDPIDSKCECKVCKNYTLAYLRHLIVEDESLGKQLLSYHNLYFLIHLCKEARIAISEWRFHKYREDFWKNYDQKKRA